MDEETVIEAIKNYAAMPDKNLFNLHEYATKFSILPTIKKIHGGSTLKQASLATKITSIQRITILNFNATISENHLDIGWIQRF